MPSWQIFLGFHHGVNGVAHSSAIQNCTIEYVVPDVLRPLHCLQKSEWHTQWDNIVSQKTITMHLPKKGSVSDETHTARWSCSLSCHNLLQSLKDIFPGRYYSMTHMPIQIHYQETPVSCLGILCSEDLRVMHLKINITTFYSHCKTISSMQSILLLFTLLQSDNC